MERNSDNLKQWKTKDYSSLENSKFNSILIDKEKIFSSTALEDTIESIKLHLTETNIDLGSSIQQKITETIVISDTSSEDDNILCNFNKPSKKNLTYKDNEIISDSSDNDSFMKLKNNNIIKETPEAISSSSSSKYIKFVKNKVIIDESGSEIDEGKIPEIIKESINDCVTLSERKKKEIINWLSTNIEDSSKCRSSQGSIISDSRTNNCSSGNSSLERLELNFETPNNRDKLSKPNTIEKSIVKKKTSVIENQKKISEFFGEVKNKNVNSSKSPLKDSDKCNRQIHKSLSSDSIKNSLKTKKDQMHTDLRPASQITKNAAILEVNDCADILDNLYGNDWRANVKSILPQSAPTKKIEKKIISKNKTERKVIQKNTLLNKKDGKYFKSPNNLTKSNCKKDSFINDSDSDTSPDCSYHTALTNPEHSKYDPKIKEKNTNEKLKTPFLDICDSDTEFENSKWQNIRDNKKKLSFSSKTSSSTSEFDPEDIVLPKSFPKIKKPVKILNKQKDINFGQKSFLASLSSDVPLNCADPKAALFRSKFKTMKDEVCKYLFNLFNEKVFESKLPEDMTIEWNNRMRNTAGFCYNKKSVKALGSITRSSRIVLATKILDNPERLRDTLIHELCHAATWLVNNVSDGHGPFWKSWSQKAMKIFPELPPIKRCHDYDIKTKFTYRCVNCGYSIGRHSKSLDTQRKRCGHCHGMFELLINKTTKSGTVQTKSKQQSKEVTGFALYVKENYNSVKQSKENIKHAEVMKILGQQFATFKIASRPVCPDKNTN